MDAVVGISQYDKPLAVQIMGLAVKSCLGDMLVEAARKEIDRLVADYEQAYEGNGT
jgi:hypothetical protein